MTTDIDNITLEQLRLIRNENQTRHADILHEFTIVKQRLASLEDGQAGILSFIASHDARIAAQHLAYDRLSERVSRIERRFELAD